jgi:flagellar basal-body rod protein FlgF
MIKGLYAAASALLANMDRQQALAHNIANASTPGFKQILTSLGDFMQTPVTISLENGKFVHYVGNLGLGVESNPEKTDFSQGGLEDTGNELDLAIQGSGFFRVRTPDGERYTRDGRFLRDSSGQLTTVDGYQVLDQGGQPIKLPDGQVSIAPNGSILVNNQAAGQLGLAAFNNPDQELIRDQSNTYLAAGAPSSTAPVTVVQGYLESSNANPTLIMTQLVEVQRSYDAAQSMVQNQDELLGKTISTLGRIG